MIAEFTVKGDFDDKNQYVKIIRKGEELGKFILLDVMDWESTPDLDAGIEEEISDWIKSNISVIQQKIEEMG